MSIQDLLTNENIRFSRAQKKVIKHLLDHYEESVFLNAAALARQVGVSHATVIRLAQALGFDGYPEMHKKLCASYRNDLSTLNRLKLTVEQTKEEDDILHNVLQQDIYNISQALIEIPRAVFWQSVDDIVKASRIFVIGLSGAHTAALALVTNLRFVRKDVYLLQPGYGEMWDIVRDIEHGDLAIGISFPRYTKVTVKVLEIAFKNEARVGAITDTLLSPLAAHAHWTLPARFKLDSIIESFVAPISIINAIVTAVITRAPQKTFQSLQKIEKLWRDEEFYA